MLKMEICVFQVAVDKCLDILDFSYKGMNINFLAKQGLIGRADYDTQGEEGPRSLMGGCFLLVDWKTLVFLAKKITDITRCMEESARLQLNM